MSKSLNSTKTIVSSSIANTWPKNGLIILLGGSCRAGQAARFLHPRRVPRARERALLLPRVRSMDGRGKGSVRLHAPDGEARAGQDARRQQPVAQRGRLLARLLVVPQVVQQRDHLLLEAGAEILHDRRLDRRRPTLVDRARDRHYLDKTQINFPWNHFNVNMTDQNKIPEHWPQRAMKVLQLPQEQVYNIGEFTNTSINIGNNMIDEFFQNYYLFVNNDCS